MALSIVQHSAGTSSANSTQISKTISATGSGPIVVGGTAGRTISTVGDDKGNTYVQGINCASGVSTRTDEWTCLVPTFTGVTVVTITFSGAAGTFLKEIFVFELAGYVGIPTFDVGGHVDDANAVAQVQNGPTLSINASCPGIAIAIEQTNVANTQNPKTGNAFTSGGDNVGGAGGDPSCSYIYPAGTSSVQPVWKATNSTEAYRASCLAIYDSISGTGGLSITAPAIDASGTVTAPVFTGTGAVSITAPAIDGVGSETDLGTGDIPISVPAIAGAGDVFVAANITTHTIEVVRVRPAEINVTTHTLEVVRLRVRPEPTWVDGTVSHPLIWIEYYFG